MPFPVQFPLVSLVLSSRGRWLWDERFNTAARDEALVEPTNVCEIQPHLRILSTSANPSAGIPFNMP